MSYEYTFAFNSQIVEKVVLFENLLRSRAQGLRPLFRLMHGA